MIQRSGVRLFCHGSIGALMLIAMAGCHESSPVVAPANVAAPIAAERPPVTSADAGAVAEMPRAAEVAETEMVSPTEQSARTEPANNSEDSPSVKELPREAEPKPAPSPRSQSIVKKPKVALSVPKPPEYVFEPQVLMSQQDMDTCLVKTGEPFPDARLADLAGEEHELESLLGEKLTVVVFWSNANRLGREQVQRLGAEIIVPFENSGLNAVAINISDSPEQIGDLFPADRKIGFTMLLDPEAELFSKVATRRQPRTYLLDAKGNILWFDIEYSRSAVRELVNAIHVALGNQKSGDS